jgi:hypothetical protein
VKDALQNRIQFLPMEYANVTTDMLSSVVFVHLKQLQVLNATLLHSLIINFKNVFLALMVV